MSDENKINTDFLFVGLTRPAMLFGVSYLYALFDFFLCMIAYIMTSNFKYMLMMLPIYLVGFYICSKEPLFIELFKVRAEKCSRCKNKFFHGANSYDPN